MRISVAIFTIVMIGIATFCVGAISGWNTGVNDGKSLYQCTTTP